MQVKALEEPYHHRGDENDGEGSLQEVLGLFPQQLRHVFGAGQPVVGQLHHEGDGLTPEQRVLVEQRRQYAHQNAQQV